MLLPLSTNAQNALNPWLVGLESNYLTFLNLGDWHSEFGYTLSVFRHTQEDFSFGFRGSTNDIQTGTLDTDERISFYSGEGILKYNLNRILNFRKFDPYVEIGIGYTLAKNINTLNTLIQSGANYWFIRNVGVNLHVSYKYDLQDKDLGLFQYLAGIVIRFGGKDSDNDGTYDKIDVCVDKYGLSYLRGCPDYDNDGVPDNKDDCIEIAGLPELKGCPDKDKDYIPDNKDKCPDIKGERKFLGCPDTDNDNVPDPIDQCPNISGAIDNKGCPWADRDRDFVPDKDDLCPDTPGSVATKGCPEEFSKERQKQLNDYAKTLLFDTGTSNIKEESIAIIGDIYFILTEYPNTNFVIEGHTDNVGDEDANQILSEKRALTVYERLIDLGIDKERLSYKGYGEYRPLTTNSTESGKIRNRRVEINLLTKKTPNHLNQEE